MQNVRGKNLQRGQGSEEAEVRVELLALSTTGWATLSLPGESEGLGTGLR